MSHDDAPAKLITIVVLGVPAPQGSKTAIMRGNRPAVIEGGSATGRRKHAAWRQAVAWQARAVAPERPLDGPLNLTVTFRLPMPASRPAAVRRAGVGWHAVKPDIDKLLRSTLDGITDGGVIVDDSRICAIHANAIEVDDWTGALIQVTELNADTAHRSDIESSDARLSWEKYGKTSNKEPTQ